MTIRRGRALLLGLLLAVVGLVLWPETPPGPTGGWMASAGVEPRFETVKGLRLRYVRAGAGPAVILIHGFASSIVTWRDVLPALAKGHDVIALDLPGFGASDLAADLSPRLYLPVVLGLMDRLRIGRASVVGNSMGGAVAVILAAGASGRIEHLVILDGAGFNSRLQDRPFIINLAGSPLGALAGHLPIRRLMVRRALRQVFFDDSRVTPERVEEYAAPFFRPGAFAAQRSLLAVHSGDAAAFADEARQVRAPTLIVWGREDAWIPVQQADLFARAIRGSRKVILEGCGHMPQEEHPAETARLVEEFLRGSR